MDTKYKDQAKPPHLNWSGPQPHSEIEAYALAIVLRMASTDERNRTKRASEAPSILTTDNIRIVAKLYAFYSNAIRDERIRTTDKLLMFISASAKDNVWTWAQDNKELVRRAEAELLEFLETKNHIGFRCYG